MGAVPAAFIDVYEHMLYMMTYLGFHNVIEYRETPASPEAPGAMRATRQRHAKVHTRAAG